MVVLMTDDSNLYQDALLAHAKAPHHAGRLVEADRTGTAHAVNALCGDEITLDVAVGANSIRGAFESKGCALCRASASIMLDAVASFAPRAALALGARLRAELGGADPDSTTWPGETASLLSLKAFPARSRCVLLPWDALATALAEA